MARSGVSDLVPQSLKPYLTYSVAAHALAAAAALRLLTGISSQPSQVYTIDFVGPSATIQSVAAESEQAKTAPQAAVAPAAPAQASEFDEFGRRHRKKPFVLPRPSLLRGFQAQEEKPVPETAAPAANPAPTASASAPSGSAGGGPPGAGVATDMPNFPYPWYISQVRASLWNLWSSRMPKGSGQCVIVFSILPNGGIVDLRTEDSSGDSAFDLTAMSAVQDAAPFPGLPKAFKEPFLKIHVTLKSQ